LGTVIYGTDNTAVGYEALFNCGVTGIGGSYNIAIGSGAGRTIMTGNSGIYIGADAASSSESSTIRIGTSGTQSSCFIAGIRGVTTGQANAINVLIDSNGQLGTVSSSIRYKKDITSMESIIAALMKLRPVRFRYKIHDEQSVPEYGLIAEEVAKILPDLVIYKDGEPETVKYHLLPAILLKALQEVVAQNDAQDVELAMYKKQIAALVERIATLENK
jgi:hypothetical protein